MGGYYTAITAATAAPQSAIHREQGDGQGARVFLYLLQSGRRLESVWQVDDDVGEQVGSIYKVSSFGQGGQEYELN